MSSSAATVFVVDDDLSIRQSLRHLLGAEGLNVAAFASAQEFLERYNPSAPGCLVLDLAMPGLNGLELQEVLTTRGSRLPIIFLTGQSSAKTLPGRIGFNCSDSSLFNGGIGVHFSCFGFPRRASGVKEKSSVRSAKSHYPTHLLKKGRRFF